MDNVVLAKIETIEKCLMRIGEESAKDWKENFTYQDALLLNLERACQASIDCAAHIVSKKKLGLPKQAREVFSLLEVAGYLEEGLALSMMKMVGFVNLAVHDYASLNLSILESIITKELVAFKRFGEVMLKIK